MNISLKTPTTPTDSIDITPHCKEGKILRLGLDHYILTLGSNDSITFAFESEVFSKLIHTFNSPIVDFIANQSNCLLCDQTYAHLELTLILQDGSIYRIDDQDAVEQVTRLTLIDKKEKPSFKACEVLDVPDVYPYTRMQLSAGFYNFLIPLFQNTNDQAVADELWRNFKNTKGGPYIDRVGWADGKLTKFAVTELYCGRVLFLTIPAGKLIQFPKTESDQNGGIEIERN